MASPQSASWAFAAGWVAASISGLCTGRPRIGPAPDIRVLVIAGRGTFSSRCAIQPVLARAEHAHQQALAHEDRYRVGLHDGPGELADVVVRPLVNDLALGFVGRGDELAPGLVEKAHRAAPSQVKCDPRTGPGRVS